jgi:hypothetical protein
MNVQNSNNTLTRDKDHKVYSFKFENFPSREVEELFDSTDCRWFLNSDETFPLPKPKVVVRFMVGCWMSMRFPVQIFRGNKSLTIFEHLKRRKSDSETGAENIRRGRKGIVIKN